MPSSHSADPDPDPDTDRLRRVNVLLEQALALPPGQRERWLCTLPPDASEFAQVLRDLLARAAVETDTFMRRPVAIVTGADIDTPLDHPGDTVGPYRLLRELGAGGMATVWLAERTDGSWQRQVALKLPRTQGAPGLAERMARERDILGSLTHPNIARLYDAGITPGGRPYLAMEVVDGVTIDAHARERGLSAADRLRLFRQVLQAASYAHARLVVHRDLKPSNILVTPAGDVRLLDFGVARLLAEDAAIDTPLTQRVGRAMTPDYASPEQIRGEAVTVGSDVYSLGVVLYELLTQQRPYAPKRRTAAALEEAIVDADVPLSSTRVGANRALARALRGDIDTILAKALKKNPAERYASVEALAADIDRHLAGLPVLARPDSFGYRAAKFVRRHRTPVLAAALAGAAVLAGVVGTVQQSRRAEQQALLAQAQRDRALRELGFAEASEEFMRFVISEGAEQPLPMRELLARASASARVQFADDPTLRARMQLMLADLYGELSDHDHAEQLLLEARAVSPKPGSLPLQTAAESVAVQVDCTLAGMYAGNGRHHEAQALFDAAQARLRALPDPDDAAPLTCHIQRSVLYRNTGDAAASLADIHAAIALIGKPRPGMRWLAIHLDTSLGDVYAMTGRHAEAIAIYERSLKALERLGRGQTTATMALRNNLAVHLSRTGQLLRAADVYRDGLRHAAEGRSGTLQTNYGRTLLELGRIDEAMPLFERALIEHVRNDDRRGIAYTQLGIAQARCSQPAAGGCEAAIAGAAALLRSVLPAGHSGLAIIDRLAAQAAMLRGEPGQAQAHLRSALALLDAARDGSLLRIPVLAELARAEQALGDSAAARQHADAAMAAARQAAEGIPHAQPLGVALLAAAVVDAAEGDASGARVALRKAVEQLRGSVGEDAPATREARERLAALT
jgi:eukaryotic-like serine/threonine-protein kinase